MLRIVLVGVLFLARAAFAASTVIYSTGFERSQGFQPNIPLSGQGGWVNDGTGGNGVREGTNQDAYVGYSPPAFDDEFSTTVWKPGLHVGAIPSNSVLRFSVDMSIADSTTDAPYYDEFHWSLYNTNSQRLFSLIFDNYSFGIYFSPVDGGFFDTGFSFSNNVSYHLEISMDFNRNWWNATLQGVDLGINDILATNTAQLRFGDIDAVWSYHDPGFAGDNFMAFDNYRISIDTSSKPSLQVVSTTNRQARLRVTGDNGFRYAVEASASLLPGSWLPISTNMVTGTSFDILDPIQPPPSRRFYRARWVP